MGANDQGEIRRNDPLEGRGFLEEEPVPETAGESGETSLQDGEAGFLGDQASTEERVRQTSRETLSKPGAKEGDVLQDGAPLCHNRSRLNRGVKEVRVDTREVR